MLPLNPEAQSSQHASAVAFTRRLFAVGGIESIEDETFARSRAEAVAILTEEPDAEIVATLASDLKQQGAAAIFLGCQPGAQEAALRDAGIDGFVHDRCRRAGSS